MARGMPAVWSAVVGVPIVIAGAYLAFLQADYPTMLGYPFLAFGAFIVLVGAYVHFVAESEEPMLKDGEEILDTRHPTQRGAVARIVIGFVLLAGAAVLLFWTEEPLVYPVAVLVLGLFFLSNGLRIYWTNSLTTYYVTTERLISEYRFVSLLRTEVQLEKVRNVQERKSFVETLVGIGNVSVRSGAGKGMGITVYDISGSTDFADEVRKRV